jgi:hypothetical protein
MVCMVSPNRALSFAPSDSMVPFISFSREKTNCETFAGARLPFALLSFVVVPVIASDLHCVSQKRTREPEKTSEESPVDHSLMAVR